MDRGRAIILVLSLTVILVKKCSKLNAHFKLDIYTDISKKKRKLLYKKHKEFEIISNSSINAFDPTSS